MLDLTMAELGDRTCRDLAIIEILNKPTRDKLRPALDRAEQEIGVSSAPAAAPGIVATTELQLAENEIASAVAGLGKIEVQIKQPSPPTIPDLNKPIQALVDAVSRLERLMASPHNDLFFSRGPT